MNAALVDPKRNGCEGVHPQLILVDHEVWVDEGELGPIPTT